MDAKTEPTDDEALVNFEFPSLLSHLPALEVVQHELQLFADIVPFLRHLSFSANLSPNWILDSISTTKRKTKNSVTLFVGPIVNSLLN
jgi:hypothetical protein